MWKVFFQDTEYGTVGLQDGAITIGGEKTNALRSIVEHYRREGESDAELVAGLDARLHGRWFAVLENRD